MKELNRVALEFELARGRKPNIDELTHLGTQLKSIYEAFEYHLGIPVELEDALPRMDYAIPHTRYSKSVGGDWVIYLKPKRIIELANNSWINQLYHKHLGRAPDEEGKQWWLTEWERQFVQGIKKEDT